MVSLECTLVHYDYCFNSSGQPLIHALPRLTMVVVIIVTFKLHTLFYFCKVTAKIKLFQKSYNFVWWQSSKQAGGELTAKAF